jgi:soluble lytic murein transglycosylase-like protein
VTRSLSEIELEFARSRRRSAARRVPRRRGPLRWRSLRALALALVLLVLLAEPTLETSKARTPARRATAAVSSGARCPVPRPFRAAFAAAAARTGVPLSLLVATAYEESRMDPSARSGAGAVGLLQVMPSTAHDLRLDGDDPAANVLAGARYLRQMLDRFGVVDLALAAYNAGPAAVERAAAAPTLATLRYVRNVEARADRLVGCRVTPNL